MAVSVDSERCQGHARCWHVAPDFFTLDEEGYCNIGDAKPVPPELEDDVERAVLECPERALSIRNGR